MADQKIVAEVVKYIDRDELAQLTKDLVDIPSPTGSERAIGEFILDWFSKNSIKSVRQEISPERINAVGILEGTANGVSLTINGHMKPSSG